MRKTLLLASTLAIALIAAEAPAASVTDPTGDFLPSYTGPHNPDLDVTSFAVNYNATTSTFLIQATLAGSIDPALPGFYAIGVNTGTGTAHPFGAIGEPNVIFNQVISVQKNGTAAIGATALDPGSVTVSGDAFSVMVPLALLPSTGFSPSTYGFNLWPRSGAGGNEVISDFAPENATLNSTGSVPEPASWAMMICGFGLVGQTLRKRRAATGLLPAA